MSYNYKKEYAKWKKWKDKEEALLKHYDVPNKKILELREFDKYQFNSNTYEFIEVTPLNFQNQPQINISPNNFTIIPNCNYFNDTDIL